MLTNLGFGASLTLVAHQGVVFLPLDPQTDDDGPLLYGDVVVTLPKARYVARILVRHSTNYEISLPGRAAERGRLHVNQTEVNTECRLDKGTHRFPWSMRLPRHTLPYERAPCGKVTNHLEAIAPGLGLMGKPLQATTRIKVVASPSIELGITPFESRLEGFLDQLGLYAIVIKSPLLTVGGLLHVSVALPSVPAEIRVIAITSRIIQNLSIQLPSDPERSIVPPHEVLSLLTLNGDSPRKPSSASACVAEPDILYTISARPHDATLLALVPSGESFALECFTRLPTDGVLRPSTIQRHTKPPIRISHEIRFEVLYQTPTSKVRVARLSQPISFITCCIGESMLLPQYSRTDDSELGTVTNGPGPAVARALQHCICERSMAELLSDYGNFASALAAPPVVVESEELRPKAVYGRTHASEAAQ